MKRLFTTTVLLLAVGCSGPLTQPMVARLSDEAQQETDILWDTMLTPSDRLSRLALLKVVLAGQLYQSGVDRLEMVSEKHVDGGFVVMRVRYDREHPGLDEFVMELVDDEGTQLRHERYLRWEVEAHVEYLRGTVRNPGSEGEPTEEELHAMQAEALGITQDELHQIEAEYDALMDDFRAAMQPAED